jgi:hypothetical protein
MTLSDGTIDGPHGFFCLNKFIGKMLNLSVIKIDYSKHSHRVLNSLSSSTDKKNLLGPIPSRLHSPTPRVPNPPREVVSSDEGNTSLILKPVDRRSLELIRMSTGGRDVSTSGVQSWNVSPDSSSNSRLNYFTQLKKENKYIQEKNL